jgi:hypothetical protein
MLPEVEEYLAAEKKINDEFENWHREAVSTEPKRNYYSEWGTPEYNEWRRIHDEWHIKFSEESRKRQAKHNAALRAARTKLRNSTENQMIIWMVDNLRGGYWSYIDAVLPILPATREELESLANEQDWCSEFDEFLSQATEAGVVVPSSDKNDVSEILEYIGEEFDVYGRRHRREIQAMVNRIVAKALADKEQESAAKHNAMVTV